MKDFTCTLNTKVSADSVAETRTIKFDLSNLSAEDLEEYAQRSIVIQAQSAWRAWMKTDKSKPSPWAADTYTVPKPGTRTADPAKKLAAAEKLLGQLTPEQIATLLDKLN